jgi:hypothetical protein
MPVPNPSRPPLSAPLAPACKLADHCCLRNGGGPPLQTPGGAKRGFEASELAFGHDALVKSAGQTDRVRIIGRVFVDETDVPRARRQGSRVALHRVPPGVGAGRREARGPEKLWADQKCKTAAGVEANDASQVEALAPYAPSII